MLVYLRDRFEHRISKSGFLRSRPSARVNASWAYLGKTCSYGNSISCNQPSLMWYTSTPEYSSGSLFLASSGSARRQVFVLIGSHEEAAGVCTTSSRPPRAQPLVLVH
jgi:hypothetical protein